MIEEEEGLKGQDLLVQSEIMKEIAQEILVLESECLGLKEKGLEKIVLHHMKGIREKTEKEKGQIGIENVRNPEIIGEKENVKEIETKITSPEKENEKGEEKTEIKSALEEVEGNRNTLNLVHLRYKVLLIF